MRTSRFAPLFFFVTQAIATSNCSALPSDAQDPLKQVQQLTSRGALAEAEQTARSSGSVTLVALGDVLVLRGKIHEADSVYKHSIATGHPHAWLARVALAELAERSGNFNAATSQARAIVEAYEQQQRPVHMHLAAGRAWTLLGAGDASAPRNALAAFDAAAAADASNAEPLLRTGDLLLERYNAPDARVSFEAVLKGNSNDARAILGIARVDEFEGKRSAIQGVRRALTLNPSLVDAQLLLAQMHLEAEAFDSALVWGKRAIDIDSASIGAWSILGATAWLTGDSALFNQSLASATKLQAKPATFYMELADAAVRNRRYGDAVAFAERAANYNPISARAFGVLGTNQLRTGAIDSGRNSLERSFALDAYNVWHKNTLDLLDRMGKFRTIESKRFQIVAPAREAELLALYVLPLLEQAYDSLSVRYAYKPPTPVRLEFFNQHADFSVRTVGLAGLGALGVSFGTVLAMDTPSARDKGAFNWGSTAWHELVHTFSLGATNNRVPRWFSEGLSVLEERRTQRGWGADVSVQFLAAYSGGLLRPVSRLNEGFLFPRSNAEVGFSYYLASLFCEWVEETRGVAALNSMLVTWRDGHDSETAFANALSLSLEQVDEQFDSWVKKRFEVPLRSVAPSKVAATEATNGDNANLGAFVSAMRSAASVLAQGNTDQAIAAFERAQALFPDYSGDDSPAFALATLYKERGDTQKALNQIVRVTARNETALAANELEFQLREQLADTLGMLTSLERAVWIFPYDISVHVRLAELAAARGLHHTAVRERRAVVLLDPPDILDARSEFAAALIKAGDRNAARKELLAILEQAPSFEKAQLLLLELRGGQQ